VFVLLDVAVTWDSYTLHYSLLSQFVNHYTDQLVSHHQFTCLDVEVLKDLSSVLVVAFHVCCTCLHLTHWHNVLDCPRGVFAQSVSTYICTTFLNYEFVHCKAFCATASNLRTCSASTHVLFPVKLGLFFSGKYLSAKKASAFAADAGKMKEY